MTKAQINFQLDADLKDQFNEACRQNWTSAAHVLREAVFNYVKMNNSKKRK